MNPLNGPDPVKADKINLEWPSQLRTPAELMQAIKKRTKTHLIRSPICSKIVLQVVGSWAYFLAHFMNKSRVYNHDVFNQELRRIETQISAQQQNGDKTVSNIKRAPLLTLSNHISCIDDPILWASLLPFTYYSTRTE